MISEDGNDGAECSDAVAALTRFVEEKDDLLELESHIKRFNVFDALGIARVEIRHSNFLAFILDPAESHGQGQLFLKVVLMDLLRAAPPELRPLSRVELDGIDMRGVDVKREWEHIDVLIVCDQPRFVVAIENKIGSEEHSNQLARYKEVVHRHYAQHRPLFVYLTPHGDDPSDHEWMPHSYQDIHNVLTHVLKTHRNAIGANVLVLLDHYVQLIRMLFMDDPEIDGLCRRIYKTHRQALELIYERGRPTTGALGEAKGVVEQDERWHLFDERSNKITFVPGAWMKWLPALGTDDPDEPQSWICCEIVTEKETLIFGIVVRKMREKRDEMVKLLVEELPRFGFKKPRRESRSPDISRVTHTEHLIPKWGEGEAPEPDKIRTAVQKKLNEVFPKLEKVASILKRYLGLGE